MDATGYGSSDDIRQREVQQQLADILDDTAEQVGLDRPSWRRQQAGDGELAVLPDDVAEKRVVDDFVRALAKALAGLNRRRLPEARLRLRLAIHYGVVSTGRLGFPGQGAVEVSRMVDGVPVRLALLRSDAELVVVLSEIVFQDTVRQPHTTLRPEQFRCVRVRNKEFDREVFVYVPGHDVHALDLRAEDAGEAGPERKKKARSAGDGTGTHFNNTFEAPVTAERINFGISYGSDT